MDIKKIFGSNVRKYRIKRGFTQEQLAELVDLGDKSVSQIETGRNFIRLDDMPTLCKVLGVEPFQLFLTESSSDVSDELQRERVLARLNACSKHELELLCDILNGFIGR